jgi:hypothetical protein
MCHGLEFDFYCLELFFTFGVRGLRVCPMCLQYNGGLWSVIDSSENSLPYRYSFLVFSLFMFDWHSGLLNCYSRTSQPLNAVLRTPTFTFTSCSIRRVQQYAQIEWRNNNIMRIMLLLRHSTCFIQHYMLYILIFYLLHILDIPPIRFVFQVTQEDLINSLMMAGYCRNM